MHEAVGRKQTRIDTLDPVRANALAVALGRPEPGDTLPPFFHQVYFWDVQPQSALGRDGHPRVGGFIPDMGLPRRMWAGGRLRFEADVRLGVPAERETVIQSVERKTGRSGDLAFVTLQHTIRQAGRVCVVEEQDLVYREEARPELPPPLPRPAPPDAEAWPLELSPVLLFRYSALTFNGHRIHYDADYARLTEGYSGLVVHGPLLAQLAMLRAADSGRLATFAFRGVQALTLDEDAAMCRDGERFWVRTAAGTLNMEAKAEWA